MESIQARSRLGLWPGALKTPYTFQCSPAFSLLAPLPPLHNSPENVRLTEPANWFWKKADGGLISKVDDDCIVRFPERMDDPRAKHSELFTAEDLAHALPRSAQADGLDSLGAWPKQHQRSVEVVQNAAFHRACWSSRRRRPRHRAKGLKGLFLGGPRQW
jgi:hypothetical protein